MDLFGNPASTSNSKKAFKISLLPPVSTKDKKKKTDIYANAKSIDEIEDKILISTDQITSIKQIYHNLTSNASSALEKHWLTYINRLVHFLNNEDFTAWEKELIYHLIYRELNIYKNFHLRIEPLEPIKHLLSQFEELSNKSLKLEHVEIESSENTILSSTQHTEVNDSDKEVDKYKSSITTFKKLYKSLLKQVHPDVLFVSSEESEQRIKTLTALWENKAYYQLLKFNHTINPDSKITLNSENLDCILSHLTHDLNEKQIELNTIYSSIDYTFYVEQFYNLSDHITTTKIKDYKNTLISKHSELELMDMHLETFTTFKTYLNKERTFLSEYLNIKYLIEDLYYTQQ